MECNLCNCNFFSGVFAAISCDDHFFKPYSLNFTANYVECLDDATVAVQLEPTLIKAITKGGFFNHKRSTFFSLISLKEDCVCLWQVTVLQVSIVSGLSMSVMW